ncbi:MAG TPA: alpha/beta hydrolase [Gemmatimonadales bacterium]|nr:alpha/beta hydrolase [Gemmatimonadales bacterium]
MLIRIALGLALAYVGLVILAWLFQERLAFPAPRAAVPDPRGVGVENSERVELVSGDGTKLVGWYLKPEVEEARGGLGRLGKADSEWSNLPQPPQPPPTSPGLLWFYGNGENVAAIWPIVREFQPPGAAVLVVDYPGYGGSAGRTTEAGLYAAADAAYSALVARRDIDPRRIYVYGRSLGSAVASYTAAHHPTAGLILESPFTSARDMARNLYALLPRFILRLRLDNLANVKNAHCPTLVLIGDADRLVPPRMGLAVAAAAGEGGGPVEVVMIHGAGHNDTYEIGGTEYRKKLWRFVGQPD